MVKNTNKNMTKQYKGVLYWYCYNGTQIEDWTLQLSEDMVHGFMCMWLAYICATKRLPADPIKTLYEMMATFL